MAKSDDKRARETPAVQKKLAAGTVEVKAVPVAKTSDVVRRLIADVGLELEINDRFAHYEKTHKGKKVVQLAAHIIEVENAKEYLEEILKYANAEYDCLRMKMLPDAAERENLESPIRIAGLGRVQLTADAFVSAPAPVKDKLYDWFRKNKLSDLITESINASTLKAWVKERIANGKPYPKDLITVTPVTRASIVRDKN